MKYRIALLLVAVISASSCRVELQQHQFPNPVDTTDKEISFQEKKTYPVGDFINIDNEFDGARLTNLVVHNETLVSAFTAPENEPINSSPWYAFRITTSENAIDDSITVKINYPEKYKHRYWPKISYDSKNWTQIDSTSLKISGDTSAAELKIKLVADTIFIAAQPIISSKSVADWSQKLAKNKHAVASSIGTSLKGREIPHLKIGSGKKTIAIVSRQHPPEVTGFVALQYFLDEILDNEISDEFLKEYCLLVYPLMNPDGVDLGHWRHNAAGVDLNRDWAYYRQPEVKTVVTHLVNTVNAENLELQLGLDFHSTWYDIYYTTDRSLKTKNMSFTDQWFEYIEANIDGYRVRDAPSGLRSPVSKGWFVAQFNVPGITYEIGDDTSHEFIKIKSSVAAEGLMKILLAK
ncbi:M14 family metallopeptidase [Ekhidna sp.]|uniref:M14 family metallopeptidase n=1 Tax=Ekhidna sp. TaxID=2608089 RepID=UPI003299EB39